MLVPPELITTRRSLEADDLGLLLPHEHVFVQLDAHENPVFESAEPDDAIEVMAPEIDAAREAGVTALVECTPVGVGRRVDIVAAVAEATGFPIVVPTGVYREPWIPDWVHEASEGDLAEWMIGELTEGIEETGVRAAWIKLSASEDGPTDTEETVLRAAAAAGAETGALIGSHTENAELAHRQLDLIEEAGYDPERFLWIHTQAEPDVDRHLEVARRGAWLEYDWIGGEHPDEYYVERIERVLEAGYGDRLLLSMDRGWYDPAKPDAEPDPFTYFPEEFLPSLREAGIGEGTITRLTHENPFEAFAR